MDGIAKEIEKLEKLSIVGKGCLKGRDGKGGNCSFLSANGKRWEKSVKTCGKTIACCKQTNSAKSSSSNLRTRVERYALITLCQLSVWTGMAYGMAYVQSDSVVCSERLKK